MNPTQQLNVVLDGRALNVEQDWLIHNTAEGMDSLTEIHAELEHIGAPAYITEQLDHIIRQLQRSNTAEGEQERILAGFLQQQITAKRTTPVGERLTAKSIARAVRDPLNVIADPAAHDGIAYFRACALVRDVIRRCTPDQLDSPTLRHELWDRRFDLLQTLRAAA